MKFFSVCLLLPMLSCSNIMKIGTASNKNLAKSSAESSEQFGLSQNVVPTGWDPYLKQRRALTIRPETSLFFETCPDLPNGKCLPTLQRKSGFYTLAHDEPVVTQEGTPAMGTAVYAAPQNCKISSDSLMSYGDNTDVPCPYKFFWGSNFGRVVNSTLGFKSGNTRNHYLGLQENIPANFYGGLDFNKREHSPYLKDIVTIKLKVRALRCRGNTISDTHSFGRMHVDFSGVDPNATDRGFQVSVILASFADVPDAEKATNPVLHDGQDQIDPAIMRPTLHLQGKNWGVNSGQMPLIYNDTSPNCEGQLDGLPFIDVEIPVRNILTRLVAEGKLSRTLVDKAKYTHGTLLGLEQWGRSHFMADVAERVILVEANSASANGSAPAAPAPNAPNAQIPSNIPSEGYYVLPGGQRYFTNGSNAFCWFIGAQPAGASLNPTQAEPTSLGLRNDGRCNWDNVSAPAAAAAPIMSTPAVPVPNAPIQPRIPSEGYYVLPTGARYYSNGSNAFCWFSGAQPAGAALNPTHIEPGALLRNDGRCTWDR